MSQQKIEFVVTQSSLTEMEMAIEEFLLAKEQIGRTPATIDKYRYNLNRFAVWMAVEDITAPKQLNEMKKREASLILRGWGVSLKRRNLAPATVRQIMATVRSFLHWCHDEGILKKNLASTLPLPAVKKRVQRTLMYDEIWALLDACDDSVLGMRDGALINFLVDTGLRASEVCRVEPDDLSFGVRLMSPEGEVAINVVRVVGKGGDERLAYFGSETARRLREWLQVRELHLKKVEVRPETLFFSLGGITPNRPLTVSGLRLRLTKLGESVGIKRVSPHAFRRAIAVLVEYAGASSRETQLYGGWSTIEQVERYTQMYSAAQKYNQHSPADFLKKLRNRTGNS